MTQPQDAIPPTRQHRWRDRLGRLRKRIRSGAPFATGVIAALVGVALYGVFVPGPKPLTTNDVSQNISRALASVTPGPALSESAYQAVAQSLVLVEAEVPGTAAGSSPSPQPESTASPAGTTTNTATANGVEASGVVVDTNGDILTCLHVIANATSIKVTFADGTTSAATVQTTQPANDIAVLRASQPPSKVVPAVLGSPRSVQVGSEAFVVGNPFGLNGSMSSGIVSGLNRSFQLPNNGPMLQGLIQVDAAVNPGSSGGPLVNRYGQVVGIVDALINPTSDDVFIGIGLAVPIDVAGGAAGLPPD